MFKQRLIEITNLSCNFKIYLYDIIISKILTKVILIVFTIYQQLLITYQ